MSKVLVEQRGHTTIVTINRAERRNAVDTETADLLRSAFAAFDAGGNFCAGYDLHSVSTSPPPYESHGPGPMGPTRMLLCKPVIAAVEGYAVAGGLELALWCDLRVASANAVFGVFCRRWGVPLIDGGTVRIVGQGRALDMILTGRPVDAPEALAMGLANRAAPEGGALDEAVRLAETIAAFPQMCMRADRMSSYKQWDNDLAEALRAEAVRGEGPLNAEGLVGASRFAGGAGRAGRFDG